MAMLTIMKAKWYQREIEKIRVRTISKARVEKEQRPTKKKIFEPFLMRCGLEAQGSHGASSRLAREVLWIIEF
jgi:hypothetical protein